MTADALADAVLAALGPLDRPRQGGPLVLGLCGAQGSGKSTLAAAIEARLRRAGLVAATLSLDDLYLTRAERVALGRTVHPLFVTRGVPGTHDLALARNLFRKLDAGLPCRLPRFDKAIDDRCPDEDGPFLSGPIDALIFEGWCVGAGSQPEEALTLACNDLEAMEDGDGRWRRAANDALRGDYAALFDRLDRLVLLAAPGFHVVADWREQQEAQLRARGDGGMAPAEIGRFTQFYERITRHILSEMPARADMVVRLAPDRTVTAISARSSGQPA